MQATRQKIPSLEQVLDAAKESNISIMFDLRPENHSDYQSFVNATLEVILQSGIPLQQVSCPPGAGSCCHIEHLYLPTHPIAICASCSAILLYNNPISS